MIKRGGEVVVAFSFSLSFDSQSTADFARNKSRDEGIEKGSSVNGINGGFCSTTEARVSCRNSLRDNLMHEK